MIFLSVLPFIIIIFLFLNTPSPAKQDKSFQFGTKYKLSEGVRR